MAATFLDPRTGEVVEQVDVGTTVEDAVFGASVAVSPDGGLVAVTSGLAVTVLDTATRDVVQRLDLPGGFVCSAEWTPDGSRLLLGHEGQGCWAQDTSTEAGDILVVDVATWEVVDRHALDVHPEFLELGPDDRSLVVSSGSSPELVVLDVNTLEELHRVSLDVDERFWDLAFSPDGRLLAGGGESGRLHVVDLDTWEAREAVSVHDGPLLQLGWLDDRTVVSTGIDGTVRLFDVERAVERVSPLPASVDAAPGYGHWITAPDGELVVFNDDRVALRYPMDPAVWLRQACAVVGRDLTPAEWDQYLPGRAWQATCSDLG